MQQMWILADAALVVFLGVEAIVDYRIKNISAICSLLMLVLLPGFGIICGYMDMKEVVYGILPGAVMIIVSILSRQSIGSGDGMMVMIIGAARGIYASFMTLIFAGTAAAVVTLFLIAAGKVKRNSTIPFIPYILTGYVGVILCG